MSFLLSAAVPTAYLWLIQLGVFGVIAALVWVAVDWFSGGGDTRTDERLAELRDPMLRKRKEEAGAGKKGNAMTRMLEDAAPALAKPLQPQNELEANKLKAKLSYAGFRNESAPSIFLGLKFFCMLAGLLIGGGISFFTLGFTQATLMRVVGYAGGGFYLPEIIVWFLAKKRKDAIFFGLPDALDLLVVCVEAGLGLDQAMRKVAEEMKKSYRVIAEEFGLCNLQLQVGRSRTQVLQELGTRSGVDDLKSLSSILIQADKFGSSIAQALRVQSEAMRTRRKQIAEEKAAKTAVQLIFPLVLFIFPGIFVVLVGPAAITMVREMFPAMQGG